MSTRFAGLLALFLSSSIAFAQPIAPREGWQVFDTQFSYPALIERLEAAVRAENMGLVTQASASNGARAQGFEIRGNRVVGVYRNDFARRMLDASIAAGIEAPVRFYIVEDADGSATLAWKTPSFVFAPYMDEGGDELRALAAELDVIFSAIAKRALE